MPGGYTYRATFALILLIGVVSCETVVDVPPPPHDEVLVAHSFFTTDSVWAVRVSGSAPFSSASPPELINDASVEIWNGDVLIAAPTLADSGTYISTGRVVNETANLKLSVSAPGYAPVSGTDSLPSDLSLGKVTEALVGLNDTTATRRRIANIEIDFVDPPATRNYYGVMVVQVRWLFDRRTSVIKPLPVSLFPFESNDIVLGDSPFDIISNEKSIYYDAFFPDDNFNGSTHTLSFDIQYDEPSPTADIVVQRVFSVVVLSVSEAFYQYWTTAGDQLFTSQNPFSEPLAVRSNIEGGLGVFGGFKYRAIPLTTVGVAGNVPDELCAVLNRQLPVCGIAGYPDSAR